MTSKQRSWQQRQIARGRCRICYKRRTGTSAVYCETHRRKHNEDQIRSRLKKKEKLCQS